MKIKNKEQKHLIEENEIETDENCYECKDNNNMYLLLLCNKCNFYCCHTYCNFPFLDKIPDEDWFCKFCIQKENYRKKNKKNISLIKSANKKRIN